MYPTFDQAFNQAGQRRLAAKQVRRYSNLAGAALLAVCALQLCMGALFLLRRYLPPGYDALWYCFLAIATAVCSLLPAALLGLRLLTPWEHNQALPFGAPFREERDRRGAAVSRPQARLLTGALVIAGAAVCFLGNLATSLVGQLGKSAGVEFEGPGDVAPKNLGSLALMLIAVAVVPALTEELLLRGVLLQPLRQFGDAFAIVSTAVLFALLHQNMEQAPMAFVSGLALGYAAVRSGSLWPGIVIHFWNNAVSVLFSFASERWGERWMEQAAGIYTQALFILGGVGLLALLALRPRRVKRPQILGFGGRLANYFFGSVPMALSLVYFLVMIVLATRLA